LIPLQLYMTDIYKYINEIGVNLQWTIITQVKNQTPKNKHVNKKPTKKLEIIYSMQYIYMSSLGMVDLVDVGVIYMYIL
jgi:hypothetical protein